MFPLTLELIETFLLEGLMQNNFTFVEVKASPINHIYQQITSRTSKNILRKIQYSRNELLL